MSDTPERPSARPPVCSRLSAPSKTRGWSAADSCLMQQARYLLSLSENQASWMVWYDAMGCPASAAWCRVRLLGLADRAAALLEAAMRDPEEDEG